MRKRWAAAAAAVAVGALAAPAPASAHGLVGRADLPIPEWLFGWAAAVVLIVSFAGLALLWQEPKLEGRDCFRPLPEGLSFALVNPATEVFAGLVGVGLLVLTVYAGLDGRAVPAGQLRPHVHLRDLLGRPGAAQHPVRRRLPGVQPVARDRARRRLVDVARRRPAARRRSGTRTGSAGGRRRSASSASPGSSSPTRTATTRARSRSRRSSTPRSRCSRSRASARRRGSRAARASPSTSTCSRGSRRSRCATAGSACGRRCPRSPGSKPSPGTIPLLVVMLGTVAFDGASEGKPWVDVAPDIQDFFTSTRVQPRHRAGDHLHDRDADRPRTRGGDLPARDRRRADGRPAPVRRDRALVHAHAGADRGRVRDRALLLAAGLQRPVDRLPGLRPARRGVGPVRHGRTRRSTTASSTRRRSGTCRWACWCSATSAGWSWRTTGRWRSTRRRATATTSQYWMLAVMVAFTTCGLFLLSQANQ